MSGPIPDMKLVPIGRPAATVGNARVAVDRAHRIDPAVPVLAYSFDYGENARTVVPIAVANDDGEVVQGVTLEALLYAVRDGYRLRQGHSMADEDPTQRARLNNVVSYLNTALDELAAYAFAERRAPIEDVSFRELPVGEPAAVTRRRDGNRPTD